MSTPKKKIAQHEWLLKCDLVFPEVIIIICNNPKDVDTHAIHLRLKLHHYQKIPTCTRTLQRILMENKRTVK